MGRRNLIQALAGGIGGSTLLVGSSSASVSSGTENQSGEQFIRDLKSSWMEKHGNVQDITISKENNSEYLVSVEFEDKTVKELHYEIISNEEYYITYSGKTVKTIVDNREQFQEDFTRTSVSKSNDGGEISLHWSTPWTSPDFGGYDSDPTYVGDSENFGSLDEGNTWQGGAGAPGSKAGSRKRTSDPSGDAWTETVAAGWTRAGVDLWSDIELDASGDDIIEVTFDWSSYSGFAIAAGSGGVIISAVLYDLSNDEVAVSKNLVELEPNAAGVGYSDNQTRSGDEELLTTAGSGSEYRLGFRIDTAAFSAGTSWTVCNAGWDHGKDGLEINGLNCEVR
ncbi:hypothetical protein AB7C87_16415 [Natrarchaeobius sp. A-rgal3]|uniref:hypothetical protein n=1 Tax=Natrarchaeobius versutus TaxID=1679078 RepID=UPI003510A6B6